MLDAVVPLVRSLRWTHLRPAAQQIITLGSILSTTLIVWQLLIMVTGSTHPVVVVITGSMEPGIKRGDILFTNNNMKNHPIQSGEIVVFKIEGKDIPIVHRVIKVHQEKDSGEILLLTKGDNNNLDDSYGIYADGQLWLQNHHIIGRVMGQLPYVGWTTILMTEKPLIKLVGLACWSSQVELSFRRSALLGNNPVLIVVNTTQQSTQWLDNPFNGSFYISASEFETSIPIYHGF